MDPGAAATLLLVTCISCLLFVNAWRRMFESSKLPPGPIPLPVVGNLLQVKSGKIVKSLLKLRETYGPVFTVYLPCRRVVVLCGYDALKEALIDQGDDFVARGPLPSFDTIFHGLGVGVSNGERWKQLRQFSVMTLRDFGMGKRSIEEVIQEESEHMVNVFTDAKEAPCDPTAALLHASANVIFSIIVGSRFNYEDERFAKILQNMNEGFHIMSSFWGQLYDMFPRVMDYLPGPHKRMFRLFKWLEDFLLDRVRENEETLDPNSPRDFIDCYLMRRAQEKQNPSSEFHVQNLVTTIMDIIFGGTETIGTTLKYGLLLLLKNPEIEEKVHEEIDRVIGESRRPAFEDRSKMPYTNAVLHEIQRFIDLFPMGAAHMVTRDIPFRDYVITKGTDIFPMLTMAHHDPTQFPDPEHFNPGNFLDGSGCFRKNNAFMPFSIGKRNCLGEGLARTELFLFLTSILKSFSLRSPVDMKDFDITPIVSGFENLPPPYKLCFIPR